MNTTNDTRLCDPDYVPVDYFHDIIPKILNRIYDRYVSHIFVKCINIENDYYHWLDDLRLIFENFGYGKMLAVESNNPIITYLRSMQAHQKVPPLGQIKMLQLLI